MLEKLTPLSTVLTTRKSDAVNINSKKRKYNRRVKKFKLYFD